MIVLSLSDSHELLPAGFFGEKFDKTGQPSLHDLWLQAPFPIPTDSRSSVTLSYYLWALDLHFKVDTVVCCRGLSSHSERDSSALVAYFA
eukprot:128227-Amphidinium_carterae.1